MSQTYTADVYDAGHVAATDLQNMEDNFAALKSSHSGATQPSNPIPGMWWCDTTTGYIKIRNAANNAWVSVCDINYAITNYCARSITAGAGLTGGGALTADRTIALAAGGVTNAYIGAQAVTADKIYPYTVKPSLAYPLAFTYFNRGYSTASDPLYETSSSSAVIVDSFLFYKYAGVNGLYICCNLSRGVASSATCNLRLYLSSGAYSSPAQSPTITYPSYGLFSVTFDIASHAEGLYIAYVQMYTSSGSGTIYCRNLMVSSWY